MTTVLLSDRFFIEPVLVKAQHSLPIFDQEFPFGLTSYNLTFASSMICYECVIISVYLKGFIAKQIERNALSHQGNTPYFYSLSESLVFAR
jgi:hypothetical protein